MNNREIVNLYWQRSEQAIMETEQKYGCYCHSSCYYQRVELVIGLWYIY